MLGLCKSALDGCARNSVDEIALGGRPPAKAPSRGRGARQDNRLFLDKLMSGPLLFSRIVGKAGLRFSVGAGGAVGRKREAKGGQVVENKQTREMTPVSCPNDINGLRPRPETVRFVWRNMNRAFGAFSSSPWPKRKGRAIDGGFGLA